MNSKPLVFLAALLATIPALASAVDQVEMQSFLPASRAVTEVFQCVPGYGPAAKIVVEYEMVSTGPGKRTSRLKALSVGGKALAPMQVAEINVFVGTDTLTAASAGCAGKDVRVSLQVFRPGKIQPGGCLDSAHEYMSVLFEGKAGRLRIL